MAAWWPRINGIFGRQLDTCKLGLGKLLLGGE
jgi:hypothetical protein